MLARRDSAAWGAGHACKWPGACLAEGKEARHEGLAVDDFCSAGGVADIPPQYRIRLALFAPYASCCSTSLLRFLEILCVRRVEPPLDVNVIHLEEQMLQKVVSTPERPTAGRARSTCRLAIRLSEARALRTEHLHRCFVLARVQMFRLLKRACSALGRPALTPVGALAS